MSTHLTAMCCLAKEIFIDFMVYRQPFPVLPNLEKWPWSSPSAFFPLILHSPNYSKPLHSDLPIIFKILGTKMSPTTPPSFYCTVWAFAAAGQDWTATEPQSQGDKWQNAVWMMQPRRRSLLMVRTSICWWHLTSSIMHHVKYCCTLWLDLLSLQ